MKYKQFCRICDIFHKIALEDLPKWIPGEFRKRLEKVEKVEKDPRLVEFRSDLPENIDFADPYEDEMLKAIRNQMFYLEEFVCDLTNAYGKYSFSARSFVQNRSFVQKNAEKIASLNTLRAEFHCLPYEEQLLCLRNNKIKVGKQEIKLSKFYTQICNKHLELHKELTDSGLRAASPDIVKFDDLPGKKDWDNRFSKSKKAYKVVFTTKYTDILGMSSRSSWTSCQDIRPSKSYDIEYASGVIGSCLSKYVGIIYLTNERDYEGRGEKMLYRCAVWLVRNIQQDKDVILVQKMYQKEQSELRKFFSSELKKHTGLDVAAFESSARTYLYKYQHTTPSNEQWDEAPYDDSNLPTYTTRSSPRSSPRSIPPYDDSNLPTYTTYEDYLLLAKRNPQQYLTFLKEQDKKKILIELMEEGNYNYINLFDRNWAEFKEYAVKAAKTSPTYIFYWDRDWEDYKPLLLGLINSENFDINNAQAYLRYLPQSWKETVDVIEKYADKSAEVYRYAINLYLSTDVSYNINPEILNRFKNITIKASYRFPTLAIKYMKPDWENYKETLSESLIDYPEYIEKMDPNWSDFNEIIVNMLIRNEGILEFVIKELLYMKLENKLTQILDLCISKCPGVFFYFKHGTGNEDFLKKYLINKLQDLNDDSRTLLRNLSYTWGSCIDFIKAVSRLVLLYKYDTNDAYNLNRYGDFTTQVKAEIEKQREKAIGE